MARRATSIHDIARLAGVSTATVSNVLNEKGSYSAATRDRVLEVARERGYVANFAAKSLREGGTRTVGLVTPDVSNDFFSTLVLRVEGLLRDAGYASYICNTGGDGEREARYVRDLTSKQVDGVVFIGGTTREPHGCLEGVPVAHVDHTGASGAAREAFVGNDMARVSHDMTETLFSRGCSRVALASVSASLWRTDEHDQAAGYYRCLAEHGIRLDKNLVLEGPHREPSLVEAERLVGGCVDAGWEFDGVVALGDRVALGAVRALVSRGVMVGRDVLVIGMDDSIYSRVSTPAISTVRRNTGELAARGVEALLAMMGGSEPAEREAVVPHEVVERATTLGYASKLDCAKN